MFAAVRQPVVLAVSFASRVTMIDGCLQQFGSLYLHPDELKTKAWQMQPHTSVPELQPHTIGPSLARTLSLAQAASRATSLHIVVNKYHSSTIHGFTRCGWRPLPSSRQQLKHNAESMPAALACHHMHVKPVISSLELWSQLRCRGASRCCCCCSRLNVQEHVTRRNEVHKALASIRKRLGLLQGRCSSKQQG